jgi:hypothetical protein
MRFIKERSPNQQKRDRPITKNAIAQSPHQKRDRPFTQNTTLKNTIAQPLHKKIQHDRQILSLKSTARPYKN